jgi:hypothetical protein
VCDQCGKKKDASKFSGRSTCLECRASPALSSSSITVALTPVSEPPLFDSSSSAHSHLSFMQRSAIIVMHKLGFKESDIVYWVGHDERTINHWINHFDQFNNVEDESRNGRPHATTDETDESIASVAQDIRFITPKEIRTRLHLDVSGRTGMNKSECKSAFYAFLLLNGKRSDNIDNMSIWCSEPSCLHH